MNDSVGTWGLYPWFPDHGASLTHPEDADHHALLGPMGPYGDGTTIYQRLTGTAFGSVLDPMGT